MMIIRLKMITCKLIPSALNHHGTYNDFVYQNVSLIYCTTFLSDLIQRDRVNSAENDTQCSSPSPKPVNNRKKEEMLRRKLLEFIEVPETIKLSKAYQTKDENLKQKFVFPYFRKLEDKENFKIQSLSKFDCKDQDYDPEIYLQKLSGLLKGNKSCYSSSPDSTSNKEKNKINKKKGNKICPRKQFKRRVAKIPSLLIQSISNKLNEIEKHLDSVYGEFTFSKHDVQKYCAKSSNNSLSSSKPQPAQEIDKLSTIIFQDTLKERGSLKLQKHQSEGKNSDKSEPMLCLHPCISYIKEKNDYSSQKCINFSDNFKIDEECDSDENYFNCEGDSPKKLNSESELKNENEANQLPLHKEKKKKKYSGCIPYSKSFKTSSPMKNKPLKCRTNSISNSEFDSFYCAFLEHTKLQDKQSSQSNCSQKSISTPKKLQESSGSNKQEKRPRKVSTFAHIQNSDGSSQSSND